MKEIEELTESKIERGAEELLRWKVKSDKEIVHIIGNAVWLDESIKYLVNKGYVSKKENLDPCEFPPTLEGIEHAYGVDKELTNYN